MTTADLRRMFYATRRAQEPDVKTNTVKNAWHDAIRRLTDRKIIELNGIYMAWTLTVGVVGVSVRKRQTTLRSLTI